MNTVLQFLTEILVASWWMLAAMAPYLLLGFVIAGLLSAFISPEWVERHLGGSRVGQIFKASLFGVPLPLCSCGVIPVAASLRRHGAGKGATTAFLLSTPQTGVDSIAVTYALLGPFLAVFRPIAALVTGFFGGTLVHVFDRDEVTAAERAAPTTSDMTCGDGCVDEAAVENDSVCCDDEECAGNQRRGGSALSAALRYGLVTLPRDIGNALLVGILLSGVISVLVKPAALEGVLGRGLVPILVAMAVGVPLYVCATASVPIAVAMIHAGLSPGAALAFLISGPATNAATLTTLWRVLGWRSMMIFLLTVMLGALGSGLAVDGAVASGAVPASAVVTTHTAVEVHHHGATGGGLGGWLRQVGAVILLLVLGNALRPKRRTEGEEWAMVDEGEQTVEIQVTGMRCDGCVQSVRRALSEVSGVTETEVWLDEGKARVRGRGFSVDALEAAVVSLGYTAVVGPLVQSSVRS
jgi:uncharacterized membrane protein YraQ (UPF0718 family)/copper chaperone CopZ